MSWEKIFNELKISDYLDGFDANSMSSEGSIKKQRANQMSCIGK